MILLIFFVFFFLIVIYQRPLNDWPPPGHCSIWLWWVCRRGFDVWHCLTFDVKHPLLLKILHFQLRCSTAPSGISYLISSSKLKCTPHSFMCYMSCVFQDQCYVLQRQDFPVNGPKTQTIQKGVQFDFGPETPFKSGLGTKLFPSASLVLTKLWTTTKVDVKAP